MSRDDRTPHPPGEDGMPPEVSDADLDDDFRLPGEEPVSAEGEPVDPTAEEPAAVEAAGHDPDEGLGLFEQPAEHEDDHSSAPLGATAVHPWEDEDDEQADRERQERLRRRRHRRIRGIAIIAVALIAMIVLAVQLIGGLLPDRGPKDYAATEGDEVTFTVNDGEGAIAIGSRLVEQGIVADRGTFVEEVQNNPGREIRAGEYTLRERMTVEDAVRGLQGESRTAVSYIVVNRGERIDEVMDTIVEATPFSHEDLDPLANDPARFGLPAEATTLEGYIASGEYRIPLTASAEEVLRELIAPTFATLEEKGVTDAQEQYRTITIASILEAEALPDDYATVAGIIENRLAPENTETGGFLQIDATLIYGLSERRLQFTDEERQDAENEYNTYQHRGLPPGPIGAPSVQAVEAAANPEDNDYYYWVTVNIETGETKFATTYAEHRGYQAEYQAWCADHPSIC